MIALVTGALSFFAPPAARPAVRTSSISAVASWYDSGARLDVAEVNGVVVPTSVAAKVGVTIEELVTKTAAKTAAAATKATEIPEDGVEKDVGTAIALLTGAGSLAAMGGEIASIDADILALAAGAAAAVVADEDTGIAGRTLRGVGNVATPVLKVSAQAAEGVGKWIDENQIGWKARAVLEIGVEAAVRKVKESQQQK